MIHRQRLAEVSRLLGDHAAVVLLGARQVGKTTLAMEIAAERAARYLDLESPSDAARLSEPELYFAQLKQQLVILDEVQSMPGLFQVLRGEIDRRRRIGERTGLFLLLGSAAAALLHQSAESLAGRVIYVELPPLNLLEVGLAMNDQLWVRGGFPESFLAADDRVSLEWRGAFIRTYLQRDIPALAPRIPSETLRRFWTMLAHNQGAPFNASRLASGLGMSGQTVSRYLDLLVDLMLVRRLEPWTSNVGKRMIRSPKVYVRDSGITHALLGLQTLHDLLGHPVVGASWEGFIIENIASIIPQGALLSYYRTSAGAEIDLILTLPGGDHWVMEIKRTLSPAPSRGFLSGCEEINPAEKYIVYPGTERYPLAHGVTAIPLAELMALIRGLQ